VKAKMTRALVLVYAGLMAFFLVLGSAAMAPGQEIIGEWNDNVGAFWKQNIKIVKQGDKFFRVSTFQDRSTNRAQLIELKAKPNEKRRFKDLKSSFGEMYVIDANGNLGLYDKDGFIRKAKKAR